MAPKITVRIIAIAMTIFSLSISSCHFSDLNSATATSSTIKYSLSELIKQGSPYLGDPSAPITIVDFSDFQCHLCARYVRNTEPLINDTYIQTGQVALAFKHLPNRGLDSMGAHLA
ncbi:MAG: thioredoxin domain-containing protein, partial [Nitrososphaeraceae archaeon]